MLKDQFIVSVELLKEKIKDKNKYPFNLDIVKIVNEIIFHPNVTFIVGDNGTGKSTLLEAIAVAYGFNPEGGSKNFTFFTKDTHSSLSEIIHISKGIKKFKDGYFLRAESFYNLASNIDKIEEENGEMYKMYGNKSLHEQSHGESFLSLLLHRLGGNGLYIFDEPEAALSPEKQLAFLIRLNELVDDGSQFIIITHSPIILSFPKSKILQISKEGIEEILYKDTDNFNLYKTFINNPDYMLNKLGINKI